jgi:hypothetical protein
LGVVVVVLLLDDVVEVDVLVEVEDDELVEVEVLDELEDEVDVVVGVVVEVVVVEQYWSCAGSVQYWYW